MRDINSFSHRIDIGPNIINIWPHFSTKLYTFHLAPQYNNTTYYFRSWSQVTNCKEDIMVSSDGSWFGNSLPHTIWRFCSTHDLANLFHTIELQFSTQFLNNSKNMVLNNVVLLAYYFRRFE